ncbi:MAG: cation transporter [bacterium]|nr:cation transporter [bacterium]
MSDNSHDLSPDSGSQAFSGPRLLQPVVCTWLGLAGNTLLAAGKILVGTLAGSAALIADGYHSLADVLSDIGILLSLKAASQPPDEDHPYGHHSFETLGAIVVAVFMLATAGAILYKAILAIVSGEMLHPESAALWASLASVLIKELMARYTLYVGNYHSSPALLANGAMHRSDAISSLAAAAGIGGAMAGWPILDSIGAIIIALFILHMGWSLLRENVMALMDTMPAPKLIAQIRVAGQSVDCVQEIIDLRARQRGSWYLVDLRITVHPDHTIESAHNIAHSMEDTIMTQVPNIARVFVHVEPGSRNAEDDCPLSDFSDPQAPR